MANIFFKDGKWWLNYRINGKRYRRSTHTANKRLAETILKDLEIKLFKGEDPDPRIAPRSTNLADFFSRFIEYSKNNYSPTHLQSDLSRIFTMREFFARRGIKDIQAITPGIYEEFESTVLKGRRPKTNKNYLLLLKTALNYGVKWGAIDRNPLAEVKPPKIIKTFHFYSKEEIDLMIEKASEPLKTAIILFVNTGLRREELYSLRWRDVDPKSKKSEYGPMKSLLQKAKNRGASR